MEKENRQNVATIEQIARVFIIGLIIFLLISGIDNGGKFVQTSLSRYSEPIQQDNQDGLGVEEKECPVELGSVPDKLQITYEVSKDNGEEAVQTILSSEDMYIIDGISSEDGHGEIPAGISPYGPGENYVYQISDREKITMARILYLECRGQPMAGMVSVAAVILNRMSIGYHGNTTAMSVMKEFGTYSRIDTVSRENLKQHPNCMEAVELALRGWDPTRILFPEYGAKYFYAPNSTCVSELKKREEVAKVVIGEHVFHNLILKDSLSDEELAEKQYTVTKSSS